MEAKVFACGFCCCEAHLLHSLLPEAGFAFHDKLSVCSKVQFDVHQLLDLAWRFLQLEGHGSQVLVQQVEVTEALLEIVDRLQAMLTFRNLDSDNAIHDRCTVWNGLDVPGRCDDEENDDSDDVASNLPLSSS